MVNGVLQLEYIPPWYGESPAWALRMLERCYSRKVSQFVLLNPGVRRFSRQDWARVETRVLRAMLQATLRDEHIDLRGVVHGLACIEQLDVYLAAGAVSRGKIEALSESWEPLAAAWDRLTRGAPAPRLSREFIAILESEIGAPLVWPTEERAG